MEETSIENPAAKCSPITSAKCIVLCGNPLKAHSRRKYVFTAQIDQLIREIYLNHPDAKSRPGIRLLARKVGMPHWSLKKRARELGLARTVRNPDLFSGEINRQALSTGEFARLLSAAIRALPYVKDSGCREELKRALCELLFNADAVA